VAQPFCATFVLYKKLPEILKNRPICQNSPNLVTPPSPQRCQENSFEFKTEKVFFIPGLFLNSPLFDALLETSDGRLNFLALKNYLKR
jgi:hypothetical protein